MRGQGRVAEAGSPSLRSPPSPRAAAGRSDHVLAPRGAAEDEAGSERERLGGAAGAAFSGYGARRARHGGFGVGGSAWRGGLAGVWTERWARAPLSLAQGGPSVPSAKGPQRAAGAQEGVCV